MAQPVVLFVLALLAAGVGAWWWWQQEQKRRAAIASFAAAKGWSYSRADPYGLPARWRSPPFGQGDDREAENVITGVASGGYPLHAFDYEYTEHRTDSKGHRHSTTYRFAVLALRLPCGMPGLHVGNENILTRIGSAVGFSDIEFESEDFNRAFRVKCDDAKFASDVLHPRAMEMLLQHGRGAEWRFEGADMLSWRSGRLDIPDVLQRVDLMCRVLQSIPTFVWKDRGYDPGPQAQSFRGR
ncbi:MAG: hypothetical protein ABIM89_11865 [Mycobacteriales bacterium]